MTMADRNRKVCTQWGIWIQGKNQRGRRKNSMKVPGACTSRSGEGDPRYRFDQRRLSGALGTNDGDHGQIHIGSDAG